MRTVQKYTRAIAILLLFGFKKNDPIGFVCMWMYMADKETIYHFMESSWGCLGVVQARPDVVLGSSMPYAHLDLWM